MSKMSRTMFLLVPAILLPFVLTTLFVAVMHGRGLSSAALHWTCVVAMACSGLPFVAIMPIRRAAKLVFASVAVPLLFIATTVWAVWIACTRFGSCP